MDAKHLTRLRADLAAFLDELMPDRLGNAARRRRAKVYLRGLLLNGHRKSVEPMAQRLRPPTAVPATTRRRCSSSSTRAPGRTAPSATAWRAGWWRPWAPAAS